MEMKNDLENLNNDNKKNNQNYEVFCDKKCDLKLSNFKNTSNMSFLTTKTDDIIDKIRNSDYKKKNNEKIIINNSENRSKYELKIDDSLFKKILFDEFKIINKNNYIANLEYENLLQLMDLKNNENSILVDSIRSVKQKIEEKKQKKEANRIANKKIHLNNLLLQHNEIFSHNLVDIFKSKKRDKEVDRLKREFELLKMNDNLDLNNIKEKLKVKNENTLKSRKIIYEKEIQQVKNDNSFIVNNILLEKDALSKKLSNQLRIIEKQREKIEKNNIYKDGLHLENTTFNQRKNALLEKINFLNKFINRSNKAKTINDSNVTNRGDLDETYNFLNNYKNNEKNYWMSNFKDNLKSYEKSSNLEILDNEKKIFETHVQKTQNVPKNTNQCLNSTFEIGLSQINSKTEN